MTTSFVQLINAALVKIGVPTIISIDDNTRPAQLAKLRYEDCRDIVLRSHEWSCATARIKLASETTLPEFGYGFKFRLPVDYLRLISVEPPEIEYKIEGKHILSDETELDILYIKQITDPTDFDMLCSEAISTYLAYDLCFALVQNPQQRQMLYSQYIDILNRAKKIDFNEDGSKTLRATHFEETRLRSR